MANNYKRGGWYANTPSKRKKRGKFTIGFGSNLTPKQHRRMKHKGNKRG